MEQTKKQNDTVKSIVVLTCICLVVAVLLAAINHVTAPIIEEAKANSAYESLYSVLPNATGFEEEELPADAPATVTGIFRDSGGSGYAVTLSTTSSYSVSPMTFTLGIGTDGKIVAVEMTNYAETKDFGSEYPQTYVGEDSALGSVDLYAGVTYSSTAFKSAVEDAFSVLVSLGGVAEGQKSEEQLIDELKSQLLPGSCNQAGAPQLKELTDVSAPFLSGWVASNNTGYLYLADTESGKAMIAVSAAGSAVCYTLDGEDVTADNADLINTAIVASDFTQQQEKNLTAASRAVAEGAVLTPASATSFGSITSVYAVENDADAAYVFVCEPYGYHSPMKFVIALSSDGVITNFRAAAELIQESDYYSNYTLDEAAYISSFIGKSADSFTEDDTLISGATMTATAATQAILDVFEACNTVNVGGDA